MAISTKIMKKDRAAVLHQKCMAIANSNGPVGERQAARRKAEQIADRYGFQSDDSLLAAQSVDCDLRHPERGPVSPPTDLQMEQDFWRAYHKSGRWNDCRCEICRAAKRELKKPYRPAPLSADRILASIRESQMEELRDLGLEIDT